MITSSWPTSPAPAFCWVLVRLQLLRARSAQSNQSVPCLTLLLLPTLEYASPALFFFLFLWTININSSRLVPQGYFSDFSFSLEALVNTQWQLNPGDLPLRPHLPSAPALLSWLRPCNRRHLCCGLPQPQFDIPLPGVSQMSRLLCLKVYCGFCSWRIKSKLVCMCYTWAPALLFQSGSFFVIVL